MFGCVGLLLISLLTVRENEVSDYLGVFMLSLIGLSLTGLGVIIIAKRSLLVDGAEGLLSRFFHLGPFQWRRDFELTAFQVVRIAPQPNGGERGGSNVVSFAGGQDDIVVRIDTFSSLEPANDLARDIGMAIGMQVDNVAETKLDDPDLRKKFGNEDDRLLRQKLMWKHVFAPAKR